ncbi:hypothetical protein QP713_12035, partial [Neisseria mucosa]|uniref:hypothetical protein n=1 Tax=Neisseria mucosa TaxID=488 RepID=UPI00254F9F70
NAKCFILESVPTTGTIVLHLKCESKDLFSRCKWKIPASSFPRRRESRFWKLWKSLKIAAAFWSLDSRLRGNDGG